MKRTLFGLLLLIWCGVASATEVVVVALFTGKAMVRVDGKQRLLSVGQTSPEGVRLISADSGGAVLEVDGKTGRYALGDQIGGSYKAPVQKLVQIWPDSKGMYRTDGSINGRSVHFLVDTGATLVALNANEARRLDINYRNRGSAGMVSTASGTARAYSVNLNSVQVGAIRLYNVDAVVVDGSYPSDVLLGNSFLGRVDMQRKGTAMVLHQKL